MLPFFAVRTRLELATLGVTGRYSNQLNYRTSGLKAGAKVALFFELAKFVVIFSIFFPKNAEINASVISMLLKMRVPRKIFIFAMLND